MRMPTTQQLRERRANVWQQMTGIMDGASGRDLSVEELTAYDAAEADLDSVDAQITRAERPVL